MRAKSFMAMVALVVAGLVAGCAGTQYKDSEVCPPPANEDGTVPESWICEKAEEINRSPESIPLFVFNTTAIAVITDIADRQWLCDFNARIANWYIASAPVSGADVINKFIEELKLVEDPEKAMLITSLINQNFMAFWTKELILDYDDFLARGGNNMWRESMLCGPLNPPTSKAIEIDKISFEIAVAKYIR